MAVGRQEAFQQDRLPRISSRRRAHDGIAKEKHLNIRQFDERMRRSAFERQKGVCPVCADTFKIEEMEADHIKPWHEGGKTEANNCQMLCIEDNRAKGGR